MPLTAGQLIVVGDGADLVGNVVAVDRHSGAQTLISAGGMLIDPLGVVVGPDRQLYIADANGFGGTGHILRIDPVTGAQQLISSGGLFVSPTGLVFGPSGDLIVADFGEIVGGGKVLRVDPVTGAQSVLSSGGFLVNPFGIIATPDGELYITDVDAFGGRGGVIKIDPVTGVQTPISSGGLFANPSGLTFEVTTGALLVTDDGDTFFGGTVPPAIVRVDRNTGTQKLLGRSTNHQGIFDPIENALFVSRPQPYGTQPGSIARIDLATGAEAIVSLNGLLVDPEGLAIWPVQEPNVTLLIMTALGCLGAIRFTRPVRK
jgi:DNA-binding beta-propeller fold protein YncE